MPDQDSDNGQTVKHVFAHARHFFRHGCVTGNVMDIVDIAPDVVGSRLDINVHDTTVR